MALADVSDLVNRMTGGSSGAPENLWWHKVARVAGAAAAAGIIGRDISLWTYDGQPSAGVAPGAVAAPTNATDGSLKQTNGAGSLAKLLVGGGVVGLNGGTLIIYDRLLHISGLNATTTTTQTVGGTLTRYTNGIGNWVWCEIYTQIGATGTTILMNYTDQDDNAVSSPLTAFGATGLREAQRLIRLPLAVGDRGVKGVTNVDLTATTGTAGDFGVTVGHPLFMAWAGGGGFGPWRSFIDGHAIPEILDDACLAALWSPTSAAAPESQGPLCFVDA